MNNVISSNNIRINKRTPSWLIIIIMTSFIKILRVTNGIIIEGNGFLIWNSTKSHVLAISHQPPQKPPPSPAVSASTRAADVAEASVLRLLMERETRRWRHTPRQIRRRRRPPGAQIIALHFMECYVGFCVAKVASSSCMIWLVEEWGVFFFPFFFFFLKKSIASTFYPLFAFSFFCE